MFYTTPKSLLSFGIKKADHKFRCTFTEVIFDCKETIQCRQKYVILVERDVGFSLKGASSIPRNSMNTSVITTTKYAPSIAPLVVTQLQREYLFEEFFL